MGEELRTWHVRDRIARKLPENAVENRYGVGGGTVVVAEKNLCLIGKGTDDSNLHTAGPERQRAVILQQDHGFVCNSESKFAMCRAAQFAFVDVRVRVQLRRIEHPETHASRVEADQSSIDVTFFEVSLSGGVEIGFVVAVVSHQVGAVDAFIVHTALQTDSRCLGL